MPTYILLSHHDRRGRWGHQEGAGPTQGSTGLEAMGVRAAVRHARPYDFVNIVEGR
jgi:hypothetical protein